MINKYIEYDGKCKSREEEYSQLIKASEILRSEINKETDLMIILEKSLLCISIMLGDSFVFYETNKRKIVEQIVKEQGEI